jgi:hypothetical protein
MNQSNELHVLISRVAAGVGDERDWRALTALAADHPAAWQELAIAQHQEASLRQMLADAVAVADRVEAPVHLLNDHGAARTNRGERTHEPAAFVFARRSAWSGWAVAALIALAFVAQFAGPWRQSQNPAGTGGGGPAASSNAGLGPMSAFDSFQNYLTRGQEEGAVIGELPKVLVESRPAPNGAGLEVLYLRQILERTIINDVYELNGRDETGQPTLARMRQPSGSTM